MFFDPTISGFPLVFFVVFWSFRSLLGKIDKDCTLSYSNVKVFIDNLPMNMVIVHDFSIFSIAITLQCHQAWLARKSPKQMEVLLGKSSAQTNEILRLFRNSIDDHRVLGRSSHLVIRLYP